MKSHRRQALLDAPPEKVWELVGDPRRHPEWWPRVIEVRGERFDEGSNYAQVTRSPSGTITTDFVVERVEDMEEIQMRCVTTGTYVRWLLTGAQGGTFVDAEFGMDPTTIGNRVFAASLGRVYFRRWLDQSLEALERAAGGDKAAAGRSDAPDESS